jgi:hypothetical protein
MGTVKQEWVLTARGKMLVGWIIAILVAAFFWWVNDAITPDECKVSADKMSHACKQLIFEVP